MMMRTTSGHWLRTRLRKDTPDSPGMRWSHSRIWAGSCSRIFWASSAEEVVNTSNSSSRVRRRASWERTSSSTTSTVAMRLAGRRELDIRTSERQRINRSGFLRVSRKARVQRSEHRLEALELGRAQVEITPPARARMGLAESLGAGPGLKGSGGLPHRMGGEQGVFRGLGPLQQVEGFEAG